MYAYSAFGVNVQSDLLFPDLLPGSEAGDVAIRFGPIALSESDPTETILTGIGATEMVRCFQQTTEGVLLSWSHVGKFLVKAGREIVIDPQDNADESIIRQIVLGPVFGILLSQRGLAVFHANAISSQDGAILIMAGKGYGKSTLAAALHARGHTLITDDVAALRFDEHRAWVIPGIPQLKLWPEAITAMDRDPGRFRQVKPEIKKRIVPIRERFSSSACVIKAVYIIDLAQTIEILPLRPKEAFMAVASEWYGTLFQGQLLKILGYERHFRESVALIDKVPVFLLKRPFSYERMNEVCQVIECHGLTSVVSG